MDGWVTRRSGVGHQAWFSLLHNAHCKAAAAAMAVVVEVAVVTVTDRAERIRTTWGAQTGETTTGQQAASSIPIDGVRQVAKGPRLGLVGSLCPFVIRPKLLEFLTISFSGPSHEEKRSENEITHMREAPVSDIVVSSQTVKCFVCLIGIVYSLQTVMERVGNAISALLGKAPRPTDRRHGEQHPPV
ncbi:hypothetical protein BDY21DRAFT_203472 [Lineolata rhizophorae]|uniref:Uncharacterized protein n=1 Tax=Lineolata rhizophorae TaxID=578093 RepID=A0A6A6P5X4_9PEZI|nr:hypothetical protein BDY21DRAFT_203472 [Lineolata rhizophorae]